MQQQHNPLLGPFFFSLLQAEGNTLKNLFFFITSVKESTMSFCSYLTSGSKMNTLAKRGFVACTQNFGEMTEMFLGSEDLRQQCRATTCNPEPVLSHSYSEGTDRQNSHVNPSKKFSVSTKLIHTHVSLAEVGSSVPGQLMKMSGQDTCVFSPPTVPW